MIDVEALEGKVVQGWNLGKILGSGADGVVYSAARDDKVVAVKLFYPEALEKNGSDEQQERVELQLQLKGAKHHPNLVEIFDGGYDEELQTLFLIMELIPGSSLNKVLNHIPRESLPKLLDQLVGAVRFLEERGLYHRDIKPANIVISDDYSSLTLLDLGIVFRAPNAEDEQRLSGDQFVASVRYSPPEFVWRREDGSNKDAWRAITFYQIGATLHDMIMRKPIFEGCDSPRATLYDSVKLRSPVLDADDCPPWLIELAKACLVKDWLARIDLVKWEMFQEPQNASADMAARSQAIRIKQIRTREEKIMEEEHRKASPSNSGAQELWSLHSQVFTEIRNFILSSKIFPKFASHDDRISDHEYRLTYKFEVDLECCFGESVIFEVQLGLSDSQVGKTKLLIVAYADSGEMVKAEWDEILTLASIVDRCQNSLIEVAGKVVS